MTRASPQTQAEVTRRIDVVRVEMATGAWTARRARELAAEWGCAERTVQDYAKVASRLIYDRTDPAEVERERVATMERASALSLKAEAAGDFRHALVGVDLRAKAAGVYAPTAIAHTSGAEGGEPARFIVEVVPVVPPPSPASVPAPQQTTAEEEAKEPTTT